MLDHTRAFALKHWAGWPARAANVRRAQPADETALACFYAGLGRQTLRRRFHCAFNGLSAERIRALSALSHLDPQRTHTLVACTAGRGPSVVIGHAGWHVDGPGSAEFALVVADAHQGQGIGRLLLQGLVTSATAQGLTRLHASVLADNRPMLRLLRQSGLALQAAPDEPGLVQACLALQPGRSRIPWPTRWAHASTKVCRTTWRWLSTQASPAGPAGSGSQP